MMASQYSMNILVSVLVILVPVHMQTDSCTLPSTFNNGLYDKISNTLTYVCHGGYTLVGPGQQVCNGSGVWDPPESPTCVSSMKCPKPYAVNGNITEYHGSNYSVGDRFILTCSSSYAIRYDDEILRELAFACSQDGIWVALSGFKVETSCTVSICDAPPQVPYSLIDMSEHYSIAVEGEIVLYTCFVGYILVDPKANQLQCTNGEWRGSEGSVPSCVVKQTCSRPSEIPYGRFYNAATGSHDDYEFMLGSHVKYYCEKGFKLVGDATLFCEQDSKWSHYPPQCISAEDSTKYCTALPPIHNGRCFCESKSDIQYCEPFYSGLHVECVCDSGYTMHGESIIMCKSNGIWDYEIPSCIEDREINGDTTGESSSVAQYHMSTLAIVVATACSVLGVLLLVMVVMVFRRRKPHPPRLCRPSSVPPPYSRVHSNSLDEHDRMLLIGYDNTQITLPSYEEATRRGNSSNSGNFHHRSGGQGQQVGEYRPLPSIPSNFRSGQLPHGETTSRHSIITTSTMNRDGISEREVFGSIDTVNVSVSDASTAVTIESMDSASSHHSNMSRRANAGSINSSNGSLVTEDVPLLDSAQRDNEIDSVSNQEDVTDKPDS